MKSDKLSPEDALKYVRFCFALAGFAPDDVLLKLMTEPPDPEMPEWWQEQVRQAQQHWKTGEGEPVMIDLIDMPAAGGELDVKVC